MRKDKASHLELCKRLMAVRFIFLLYSKQSPPNPVQPEVWAVYVVQHLDVK